MRLHPHAPFFAHHSPQNGINNLQFKLCYPHPNRCQNHTCIRPRSLPFTPIHPRQSRLHNMDITRRHAARNASLLNLHPPIPRILLDEHEPLPLHHGVLVRTLRRVLVQRLDVLQLLGTPARRHRRPLLLAARPRRRRRRRRVRRLGPRGRRDRRRCQLDIRRGDDAFLVAGPHFDPAGAICVLSINSCTQT